MTQPGYGTVGLWAALIGREFKMCRGVMGGARVCPGPGGGRSKAAARPPSHAVAERAGFLRSSTRCLLEVRRLARWALSALVPHVADDDLSL
jgi:hypothetical protein